MTTSLAELEGLADNGSNRGKSALLWAELEAKSMLPCHLLLVRHGHTTANEAGPTAPMSGWTDVPLSDLGRREAAALGRRLGKGVGFDAVYSSPLARALETAQIALGALRGVTFCNGLREINCGEVDGMPLGEVEARYVALWSANLRQDNDDFRWPGGESYHELRCRSVAALRAIADAHAGQRVILFTHAGVISQVLGAIHHLPAARWESFRPGNARLTWVDWQGNGGELIRFDDRGHLRTCIEWPACVVPGAPH